MNAAQRSQPYFFAFDTKAKPGRVMAHCVRFETLDLPASQEINSTNFTLLGADYDKDFRIRDAFSVSFSFVLRNQLTPVAGALNALLKQVADCCVSGEWDQIEGDQVRRIIAELKL